MKDANYQKADHKCDDEENRVFIGVTCSGFVESMDGESDTKSILLKIDK